MLLPLLKKTLLIERDVFDFFEKCVEQIGSAALGEIMELYYPSAAARTLRHLIKILLIIIDS